MNRFKALDRGKDGKTVSGISGPGRGSPRCGRGTMGRLLQHQLQGCPGRHRRGRIIRRFPLHRRHRSLRNGGKQCRPPARRPRHRHQLRHRRRPPSAVFRGGAGSTRLGGSPPAGLTSTKRWRWVPRDLLRPWAGADGGMAYGRAGPVIPSVPPAGGAVSRHRYAGCPGICHMVTA